MALAIDIMGGHGLSNTIRREYHTNWYASLSDESLVIELPMTSLPKYWLCVFIVCS